MTTESSDTRPAGGDQSVDRPAPTEPDERVPMVEVIEHLLANLDAATLPLDVPGVVAARQERDRVATQVPACARWPPR